MKKENKRYINFVRKEIQNELDIFQNFYKDLKRKIIISIRSKLICDKKFKLKRLVNFVFQNLTVIIYETLFDTFL